MLGSPPRAWGQCSAALFACSNVRFTPTGVGTMVAELEVWYGLAVHPHGRGDNCLWSTCGAPQNGSPPRAWGQFARASGGRASARFTPTGVGTISSFARPRWSATVHPHGRGDNDSTVIFLKSMYGSPPRAWGQ